jgi:hypothetical protein
MLKLFLFWSGLCLAGGCGPVREAPGVAETSYDSLANAPTPRGIATFTIKDDVKIKSLTVRGQKKNMQDLLVKFYSPDRFVASPGDDAAQRPDYIITDAQVMSGKFFNSDGGCEERSLILCNRGDFVDGEQYDLLILATDSRNETALADKIFFEGSQGENLTDVAIGKIALTRQENCAVLTVTSVTEGGEINLYREEWVEFYISDGISFRSILKLQLEETDIQEYRSAVDEQVSTSSTSRYELLKSARNGLFDLKVHYRRRENGKLVEESDDLYTFDGRFYVKTSD